MQRVTITLDDDLVAEIDRLTASKGYQNRSEAIRDLTRAGMRMNAESAEGSGECIGALVYVYDHEARDLAKRLTRSFHHHHDLTLSALHIHLDHDSCMEVAVLRGEANDVQHLADSVIAERGVRYGRLVTVPVSIDDEKHPHGHAPGHRHAHVHVKKAG